MGDGGNELVFHALRLFDFQGHVVECVGQVSDFVVIALFNLHPIGACGDTLGHVGDAQHGVHDGGDKVEIGEVDNGQDY
jgi:hypothetical protein